MKRFFVLFVMLMFVCGVSYASGLTVNEEFVAEKTATFGVSESAAGSVKLLNATNTNYVTIQSGVTTGSYTLTMPAADADGYLKSDGSGTLSFASAPAVAYDDIGDPDANGSISFGAYTGTYTSDNATWGGIIIENSAAEIGASTLLTLDCSSDSADADWTALLISDATSTLFDFGGDGVLTFANAETISNTTDGEISIGGNLGVASTNKVIMNGAGGDADTYFVVETGDNGKLEVYVQGVKVATFE